jgi:HSP20 family molecular chaperone IbpA
VALAGVGKNNIDVKVREGHLYIEVLKEEKTEDSINSSFYVKRGISTRKGQLSFLLNENANVKEIKSSYIDGLLRVTVPVTQPEVLNIDIKVD